jgi:hypothetical protein
MSRPRNFKLRHRGIVTTPRAGGEASLTGHVSHIRVAPE